MLLGLGWRIFEILLPAPSLPSHLLSVCVRVCGNAKTQRSYRIAALAWVGLKLLRLFLLFVVVVFLFIYLFFALVVVLARDSNVISLLCTSLTVTAT